MPTPSSSTPAAVDFRPTRSRSSPTSSARRPPSWPPRSDTAVPARGVGRREILGAPPLRISTLMRVDLLEREHEIAVLTAAIATAAAGQGSGVAVIGDSGAGKSVLLEAVARSSRSACACSVVDATRSRHRGRSARSATSPARPGSRRCCAAMTTYRSSQVVRASCTTRCEPRPRSSSSRTCTGSMRHRWRCCASWLGGSTRCRSPSSLSYRDNEIGQGHSARPLLGDFARLDALSTLPLGPLSIDGVKQLLVGTHSTPTGAQPHRRQPLLRDRGGQGSRAPASCVGTRRRSRSGRRRPPRRLRGAAAGGDRT